MGSRRYHYFIDPLADKKLAEHIEFLARVSEKAAIKLYDEYNETIEYLENYPESCSPYYPSIPIDAELRYILFSKRYRIVFEIVDNKIYAYDVQDCRQDDDKKLV